MTDFSKFIENMEQGDPKLFGGKYTWKKGDSHRTAARLDRFSFSEEWEASFRNIRQNTHRRVTSDHSPIILQCGDWERTKSCFKFKNWWLDIEGFTNKVKE